MKASKLIEYLNMAIEREGDNDVELETFQTTRFVSKIFNVLIGHDHILLVSKEAMDNDPLNSLPVVDSYGRKEEEIN